MYDQNRAGQTAVLTQPFPANQQMVVGNQNPGTNQGNQQGNNPSTANIFMFQTEVDLQTRAKNYDTPIKGSHDKEATTSQSAPLQIERLPVGMMPHIPKSVLKKSAHNLNARAAQNYSIVEDLAQTLCAMSALEVLQACPAQRKALLSTIGAFKKSAIGLITFETETHKTWLPSHAAFQINDSSKGINIHRTIIDEGASTCVMSLTCWKALKCPELVQSNQLLKAFDGHTFKPHGIIPTFPVELGGKTVSVEVEVVDAPINYNLLLGWSWTHAMTAVLSTVFRVICFPHEGNIVTIDQLDYFKHDLTLSDSSILLVDSSEGNQLNLGVGMYPSLMGCFNLPPPSQSNHVFTISQIANRNESRETNFRTQYHNDSWTLPDPNASTSGKGFTGMAFPLSAAEIAYLDITVDHGQDPPERVELDQYDSPAWHLDNPTTIDSLDLILPSDEAIMEAMTETERPWEDLHHRSYSSLDLNNMQVVEKYLHDSIGFDWFCSPVTTHDVFAEGNMSNISKTIPINISKTPGKIENVLIGADCSPDEIELYMAIFKEFRDIFAWSYEEMPGIDPRIVEHEIKNIP